MAASTGKGTSRSTVCRVHTTLRKGSLRLQTTKSRLWSTLRVGGRSLAAWLSTSSHVMARVRGYKYLITKDWDSGSIGYRALRITTMIKNHKGLHDVDSMVRCVATHNCAHVRAHGCMGVQKSIQLDSYSQLADDFITLAGQLIPPTMLTSGGVAVLVRESTETPTTKLRAHAFTRSRSLFLSRTA